MTLQDDLRHGAGDMSETKRFIRCDLCGRMVEDGQHQGWRPYPVENGYPMWACDEEFARNEAEALARLESLAAARTRKTPPLSDIEWLSIFCD